MAHRFSAVVDAQLAIEIGKMPLNGAGAEEERLRHVAVAVPVRHEFKNLRFARGQTFPTQLAWLIVSPNGLTHSGQRQCTQSRRLRVERWNGPRPDLCEQRQRLFAARHTEARGN
jgi:hypothetical protein